MSGNHKLLQFGFCPQTSFVLNLRDFKGFWFKTDKGLRNYCNCFKDWCLLTFCSVPHSDLRDLFTHISVVDTIPTLHKRFEFDLLESQHFLSTILVLIPMQPYWPIDEETEVDTGNLWSERSLSKAFAKTSMLLFVFQPVWAASASPQIVWSPSQFYTNTTSQDCPCHALISPKPNSALHLGKLTSTKS